MPSPLAPDDYRLRVIDHELDELIAGGISAIALEGAKAVGKTATAATRVEASFQMEDPAVRQLLEADPSRILTDEPVLIDEWQQVPSTWDTVRRAVDEGANPGQFFLTGSASAANPGTHSGAGRIVKLRMRPMTLAERDVETPSVSLAHLLAGAHAAIAGETVVGLEDYVSEITASGFPAIRPLGDRVRRAQLQGYTERVIDRDIPDITGRAVRNPAALRRWMSAYAAATGTNASYEKIRDAATAGESSKPARSTTAPYRDMLEALYIVDPLPAWLPTNSHIAELASAPKHHLVDPAVAVTLLGLGPDALLSGRDIEAPVPRDGSFLGALFESLVLLDIRVFAQAAEASVGHLRTHRGTHEVDIIVERADRRVVAIEVKLSATVDDDDLRQLRWLKQEIGDDLLEAVVVTTGHSAYRRRDGVVVVPAALLGP